LATSVYSRALQKAIELAGGRAGLCRRLRIKPSELEKWLADKAAPPLEVFLKTVDFLIEETPVPGDDAGADDDTPAPRDCAAGDPSTSQY
jgi:hypothetical protein